ncbi:probable pectinesterase/pectinesterase inhibitor 51 [Henckelia pumila]|uniref:probable pectinesterase/pectinesterase inhibitor 51 n=1 Tax=Henckelia pumila TaxID=405737 RepID=UPI003C6E3E05
MMQYQKYANSPPTSPTSFAANKKSQQGSNKLCIIAMAVVISVAILLPLMFFTFSAAARQRNHQPSSTGDGSDNVLVIREACKASRDPQTCQAWVSHSNTVPAKAAVSDVVRSAVKVASRNLDTGRGMVQNILDASVGNQNRTYAATTCLDILRYSDYRLNLTGGALEGGSIKDARAWVSAALAYQYGCWSGLKLYANDTDTALVQPTMEFLNSSLIVSTSNALAMLANYDAFGDQTESWSPPKTERDGFWVTGSGSTGSGFVGGVPPGLKADVTVCKGVGGGACDYKAVQDAVNAVPDESRSGKRFVIWIKEGVYVETVRVPLEKKNVVFVGDGMGKTVISGSMNVGQAGMTTYESATVGVLGDGFMAANLTIQNTAGPDAHQAVAFRSDSDLSILENCEFIGNQDTLYAHSLRQYFKSCRIQGNIDFIFGQSAAFFQDCLILVAPRQLTPEKGENNAVTAHGRIDPGQSTGFVFQNCVVNGTDAYMALYYSKPSVHKNYLGRPWKEYSRTVFVRCQLEALIAVDGWMPWSGDFALNTLYYGEFENTGTGSDTSKRVNWSSIIPAKHVDSYSLQSFIQGDQWVPASSS